MAFLTTVQQAFKVPVRDAAEVRAAMGRAMVGIVLGDISSPLDPAGDVTVLFDAVQSPVRRLFFGFAYKARRQRLYDLLARKWDAAIHAVAGAQEQEHTLITHAARTAANNSQQHERTALLEQVPHWMFTFTGSGTDLLVRTLCLITSRPAVRERVIAEVHAAGAIDRPEVVDQLSFVEACLLETGRLFPPVTRTFHETAAASPHGQAHEYVHYFPLLQRDDQLGSTVHAFRPERWLEPTLDRAAQASNLFLRGPRACPGMDLILFVCKAALAQQIAGLHVIAVQESLRTDPLPYSFPNITTRFTTGAQ
jgi:hypothetical protein